MRQRSGEVAADASWGRLFASTMRDLSAVGREDTPLGIAALLVAQQLDGALSASGRAQLTKQLTTTLAEAMRGTSAVRSSVDELRERRDALRRSS